MRPKVKRLLDGSLREATRCPRPLAIPFSRPRGTKAEGLRYERAFSKSVGPSAIAGQWFRYSDSSETKFCQTDLLLEREGRIFVFEVKLSWTEEADRSLRRLYLPVVERAFGLPARGIVVCERLRRGMFGQVVGSLEEALARAVFPSAVVLHWLRGTPLALPKVEGRRDAA